MTIVLNSREYECWHEAGHAVICLLHGGRVELLEIIKNESLDGRARARCETTDDTRPYIACGGFAAEYYLYKTGQIDATEKEFVTTALINAFPDKEKFFGANHEQENGCWPNEMDVRFRDFAIFEVFPLIEQNSDVVSKLANKLLNDEFVAEDEIQVIVKNSTRLTSAD